MSTQPIGIFDSGIGGTSILKEIVKLLPQENIIYLADSANAPYGERPKEEIVALCKKNVDWLLSKNCKLIVVACNTATTNAIGLLRNTYNVPFIGIEPAIKPAALKSKTHVIGVLATKGTLTSQLFVRSTEQYTDTTKIVEVVGKGLVEYIEKGDFHSPELRKLLKGFISPLIKQNIDYLVLGCSHYPYLIDLLKDLLPANIKIIDSGEAVAKQTKQVLTKNKLLNKNNQSKKLQFFTNSHPKVLENISKKHFNNENIHLNDLF